MTPRTKQQVELGLTLASTAAVVSIAIYTITNAQKAQALPLPAPLNMPDINQVIATLNTGGSYALPGGDYILPQNFSGIFLAKAAQSFTMAPNTTLWVPNGYPLPVIELNDSFESQVRSQVIGGKIQEMPDANGNTQGLWTGERIHSSSANGTFFNNLLYTWFERPKIGVEFIADSPTAFVNSNNLQGLTAWHPVVAGYQFTIAGNSYAANHLINCNSQLGSAAGPNAIGVKGVTGLGNIFDDCYQYDPAGAQEQSTLTASAIDTIINGRGMTDVWTNGGVNTGGNHIP